MYRWSFGAFHLPRLRSLCRGCGLSWFSANQNSGAGFAVATVSTLFTLVTGHLNVKDTASQRKFKSTADVLESVLAEPASEYSNSMHSSSEGEDFHSQSSAESSAGEDVSNSSSPRKRSS